MALSAIRGFPVNGPCGARQFLSPALRCVSPPIKSFSPPCGSAPCRSGPLLGLSARIQFASRLCRAGPNHLKDNHSLSAAAPFQALPIRLSSWLFLANPPRFLPKLLLRSSRRFHVGSDQTVLFPIWSGPVCAMPSLSEQIQFKERQFRLRSLLTSPAHRIASLLHASPVPVGAPLFLSVSLQCCSNSLLFVSITRLLVSNRLQSKSIPIRIDCRRDHLSRRSIWKYGVNFALCS